MTIPVGVIGAAGRMGATVCSAVSAAEDMELVAGVDVRGDTASLDALVEAGAAVAVDFTVAGAAVSNAEWCSAHGIHCVIGTTGLGDEALDALRAAFPPGGPLGCIVAPNFAIGAVLMMHFAVLAAPWFETAEIIELHHDRKVDAPSGTAMLTAARMAAASSSWAADPTEIEVLPGARGGLAGGPAAGGVAASTGSGGGGGIRVHSVRMRGMVAHQEVILGTTGQTLTIRHDSMDRESFMPGVLLAVRAVGAPPGRPGVTVGLEALLGLG